MHSNTEIKSEAKFKWGKHKQRIITHIDVIAMYLYIIRLCSGGTSMSSNAQWNMSTIIGTSNYS